MHPTKTKAIKAFLTAHTHVDLASMYSHDMECQVLAAQDHGEAIEGVFQGNKWRGYTDGDTTWKPFRIPWKAWDNPEYTDTLMTWDLHEHCEAIGMTGWDWVSKCSRWVAFDFDAICGHSDRHARKLSQNELRELHEAAEQIDWITIRASTSGQGLHIYVLLDNVPTENHTEHQALARSIIGKMSALASFDFVSNVDICGGNMWVYHRKMKGTNGLRILKQGQPLYDIPPNWRDHMNVIKGASKRAKASTLVDTEINFFEDLVNGRTRIRLDEDHKILIKWLESSAEKTWWWDADRHMLVTHTHDLKRAHETLNLKGIFETASEGKSEQNCFGFPIRRGGWALRRYSIGVNEHPSWQQDNNGWTRCFFNREPDLHTVSMAMKAVEDPTTGYHFKDGAAAKEAGLKLGADIPIPDAYDNRPTTIKKHKDGKRLIIELPRNTDDNPKLTEGWLDKGKKWVRIINSNLGNSKNSDGEVEPHDDVVRHVVTTDKSNAGWTLNSESHWHNEPLEHVKSALASTGLSSSDVRQIIGDAIMRPWHLTIRPFHDEYPGGRSWNRNAPQFLFLPQKADEYITPTWRMILNHLGKSLTLPLKENKWAVQNGIKTGADYLICWIASMFQYPLEPLPFLFFFSEKQGTGKSLLHEALSLLFSPGYVRADRPLTSQSGFNGELENAVLCVVEETNLSKNRGAYDRIKDWVTAKTLSIRALFKDAYMIPNTTHWIQCANTRDACPIFPGDTRITMIEVANLPMNPIPKRDLLQKLAKEAPEFLGMLLSLEIPAADDRLYVPVIETSAKDDAIEVNQTPLELFIQQMCFYAPGELVTLDAFYKEFINWLDPTERYNWNTKQKVSSAMPSKFPKGRLASTGAWCWGNISFSQTDDVTEKAPYVSHNGFLEQ